MLMRIGMRRNAGREMDAHFTYKFVRISRESDGGISWPFCILRSNGTHNRFCMALQSLANVDLFSGNLIEHFVSFKSSLTFGRADNMNIAL